MTLSMPIPVIQTANRGSLRPFNQGPAFASNYYGKSNSEQNSNTTAPVPPHTHYGNPCPDPVCRVHPDKKPSLPQGLATVAGYMGAGFLLHKLPPRLPKDGLKTMLPADWKVWAKVLLGIAAVQKLNQTISWKPAPWLGALEAVSIINPIAVGISKNNLIQMGVMAPVVAVVVQAASSLQKKIAPPLEEKYGTPPVLTRLGISLALGVGSLIAYPFIYRRIAGSGILGKELKDQALESGSSFASAAFATCARGCSPGSFICLGEVADVVGSFGSWDKSKNNVQTNNNASSTSPANKSSKNIVSKQIINQQKTQS